MSGVPVTGTPSPSGTLWQKNVERIRRIPRHGVASLRDITRENQGVMETSMSCYTEKRTLTIELNQVNTCFTFNKYLRWS